MRPATDVPILVVTGYSGSGKTTLIERLLPELQRRGYRVGVIKHHSHHLTLDQPGKDSDRFWQAGADAVGMVAADRTVIMQRTAPLTDLQALANLMQVDIVLAEGFKQTQWPRLLVLGDDAEDALRLGEGCQVLAVVGVVPDPTEWPQYGPDDITGIADRIEEWLRGQRGGSARRPPHKRSR